MQFSLVEYISHQVAFLCIRSFQLYIPQSLSSQAFQAVQTSVPKMKFTHPALLALLSTTTAIPFFQDAHSSRTLALAPREAPLPTTPTNFPTFTMPMGTGFDGSPTFPTGTGVTPHHGGHGKPSGSDKHHSKAQQPLPTKSKPMNLPRQFPTDTPPSWGSWPTGWGSWPTGVNPGGDNGAGFGGGGASPSGWKRGNRPRGGSS